MPTVQTDSNIVKIILWESVLKANYNFDSTLCCEVAKDLTEIVQTDDCY